MKSLAFYILATWFVASPARGTPAELKVELFSSRVVKSITLAAAADGAALCGIQGKPCLSLASGETAICARAGAAIRCHSPEATRQFRRLLVTSSSPFRATLTFAAASLSLGSVSLRSLEVTPLKGGLRAVARVDLENYLAGVLAGEASGFKSPAAREAMAIVARTWALRWRGRHHTQGFDFCSLTHCQVFRPSKSVGTNSSDRDAAVEATRGRVLTYDGKLINPYFSACCGGMTEAAGNVWPDSAAPYLVSIRDPYCAGSAHSSWQRTLSLDQVESILRRNLGLALSGPLSELVVERADSSGRALALRVVAGSAWRIDANKFRYTVDRALGWATLKSNLYTIRRQGSSLVFNGHGLGHGVGLCQAGAERMGEMGFSVERILSTYFPGTAVESLADQTSDPVASSEHFELFFPTTQEPRVQQTLDLLEAAYRALGTRAEILQTKIRVKTWNTTAEFIHATGQPGWSAAANDGHSIALQPLGLLARKGMLQQTLRHEFTHLVVHRLCAPGVPDWFEEGLVLYLTRERIAGRQEPLPAGQTLDEAIRKPRTEAEMRASYRLALERVASLARERGESHLWHVLERPTAEDLHWLRAQK